MTTVARSPCCRCAMLATALAMWVAMVPLSCDRATEAPKVRRVGLVLEGEFTGSVTLRYTYDSRPRFRYPLFQRGTDVELIPLARAPGEKGGQEILVRPFRQGRLLLDGFKLGPGWSIWEGEQLRYVPRDGGKPDAAPTAYCRQSIERLDLLAGPRGGRVRVRFADTTAEELDLYAPERTWRTVRPASKMIRYEVRIAQSAIDLAWHIIVPADEQRPAVRMVFVDGDRREGASVGEMLDLSAYERKAPDNTYDVPIRIPKRDAATATSPDR